MGKALGGRARRVCFAAAATCLLLALVAPSSAAQEGDGVPRPEVFTGHATAQVASVQADRAALLPVPELFKFVALDGVGTYSTSKREARSSLLFPGNGGILGPSLLCGTFGAQFPPQFKPLLDTCLQYKYPLTVFADDLEPDGATSGSLELGAANDPISGNAVRAKAHTGEDATTTDAVLQDLRVLGVPAFGPVTPQIPGFEMDRSLLTVDNAVSRTDQRIVKGVLVVDTEATLSGIRLVGGLIRIASLRSVSRVTDDANGTRTSVADLQLSGVTVFGQPAQITEKGLVLGPSGSSGPLDQQRQKDLNELLRNLGVRLTLLPEEESIPRTGAAVAGVGGLLVEVGRDVQGLPTIPGPNLDLNGFYTASIQLGTTAARGAAYTFGIDDDLTPDLDDFTDFSGGFADLDDFTGDDEVLFAGEERATPDTPAAPSAKAGEDETASGRLARSVGDLFGDRIGLVYLSLMFAVLGCCVAPAFTIPARFSGHRS